MASKAGSRPYWLAPLACLAGVPVAVGLVLALGHDPLGLTLEALHGFKVRAFVGSEMRSELFRLAHAPSGDET